eukprot:SAG22_NODE_14035_length_387_cov_0.670139_1_plen_33_part_01
MMTGFHWQAVPARRGRRAWSSTVASVVQELLAS